MSTKESYVYILASQRNGTLYIGLTSNLVKRIWEHKSKVVPGFTEKYNVSLLVYYEFLVTSNELLLEKNDLKSGNGNGK